MNLKTLSASEPTTQVVGVFVCGYLLREPLAGMPKRVPSAST